jgi:hypothetical protein
MDVLQAAIQGKIASIGVELAAQRAQLREVNKELTYVQEPSAAIQHTDEYMLM